MVTLTVKNYLSWCSVDVAGNTTSTATTQTVCVPANGTVNLSATALTGFEVTTDDWHDVDSQQLTGNNMTSKATKAIGGADTCVWVCCRTASDGGTDCPSTDLCP
jgi:hypothetical protein